MPQSIFEGKTIIITGASSGVGAACAREFADNKAKLVLIARGEEALKTVAEKLSKLTEVMIVPMDVSDTKACINLFESVEQKFGSIDILINNAGMHLRGTVDSRTPEDFAAMVDVNLRAPIVLTTAAIPYLKKTAGGAIVMVGSLAGRAPMQGAATYSSTKAGLRAFTYALADELRETGIQVGLVSPGPINTGFIMDEIEDVDDIVYSQPMSSTKEVAEAILAIASGNKTEISMPGLSGKLTTLMYLFPKLRRKVRPMLQKKGRKNKQKYLR